MKSELAILRDEWLDSVEGKQCCNPRSLRESSEEDARKYLRNRLEAAFLAGAEANHKAKKEICDKILAHGS